MIDLTNKTALVTGSSRGIGKSIADKIEYYGAKVLRTNSKEVDFRDKKSTDNFLKKIKDIEFDILVNNAGICINNFIGDISYEDFDNVQKVNLYAPFRVTQIVCEGMKKKGYGRIVNISSIKGTGSSERRLSYTTSKSGLNGMTRTMACDLAPYGILVNSISPGFTNTELTDSMLSVEDKKYLIERIPIRRFGEVEDVANLVSFFVSDLNKYVTGQDIIIDGGYTINM